MISIYSLLLLLSFCVYRQFKKIGNGRWIVCYDIPIDWLLAEWGRVVSCYIVLVVTLIETFFLFHRRTKSVINWFLFIFLDFFLLYNLSSVSYKINCTTESRDSKGRIKIRLNSEIEENSTEEKLMFEDYNCSFIFNWLFNFTDCCFRTFYLHNRKMNGTIAMT